MTNDTLFTQMLMSVESQLVRAIECFDFTSYAEAKAHVQARTTAGPRVWQVLDAKYLGKQYPHRSVRRQRWHHEAPPHAV